jgi:UDP:flavonoid glycosyltransferase YjiC (YdhE family)
MRVLVTPYPSVAHLLPFVPLAWALQNAGHEVRVASHFSITSDIAAAGLTPVPLGDPQSHEARNRADAQGPTDPEDVLRYAEVLGLTDVEREHWIEFFQYFAVAMRDYIRPGQQEVADLFSFAAGWQPDLVLWDSTFPSPPVAARVCGAAHARLVATVDATAWCLDRLTARRQELRAAGLAENPLADLVRPLADEHGLAVDRELLLGQWTINAMPPGYGPSTSVTPIRMRHVPYSGGEVLQQWLHQRPQRPRVALSLGESGRRFIPGDWDRAGRILEAVAGLDIEVIATLSDLQLQGVEHIPDNVRTIEWVPLTQLLPSCAAVIHHGGPGTFGAACAYRVPQLVCDTGESILIRRESGESVAAGAGTYKVGREFGVREEAAAPRWILPAKSPEATIAANYVTRHGAGVLLNHRAQSVGDIGRQILQVVGNASYHDGADDIYTTWLATPSPADIAGTLETLTARHQPNGSGALKRNAA